MWVLFESFKSGFWALKQGIESIDHPIFIVNFGNIEKLEILLTNHATDSFLDTKERKKISKSGFKRSNTISSVGSTIRNIVADSRLEEFLETVLIARK